MTTVESLRRQVDAIRTRVGRPGDPKHWILVMAEGTEIPAAVKSHMGEHDTVFIESMRTEYFYGMFGDDASGSCTVMTSRGNYIVSMDTGEWTPVRQQAGSRR